MVLTGGSGVSNSLRRKRTIARGRVKPRKHAATALGLNSRIHAVGHGADWIRLRCREVFGGQGHFLCDFFHVSEYLGAVAPVAAAIAIYITGWNAWIIRGFWP